jgi:UDP-N-acetylglucosamine 2-epimerase (non-hydrolysing)
MKMRIVNIVGARPNFMKMAPLLTEYARHPDKFAPLLVHTGQHYDDNMSRLFFEQLGLPKPDVYLGVGSGSHATQTARVMIELEKLLSADRPHLIVVVGDVNSTMAAAIVAAKLCIPVAHVEAGLRSFDRTMPEEVNRVVTDVLSDYCFTTCADAGENLLREGVAKEKVFFVGNVMIDTLLKLRDESLKSNIRKQLMLDSEYGYVTLHRPSNVDSKAVLGEILTGLETVQQQLPLAFAVHPRTQGRLEEFGYWDKIAKWPNMRIVKPLGYLDSLCLMAGAKVVLTDSGGIQEETTVLGIPCLTIRENTDRPVTVTEGTSTIVGTSHTRIVSEARKIMQGQRKNGCIPKYWDGKAASRIVNCLLEHPPIS